MERPDLSSAGAGPSNARFGAAQRAAMYIVISKPKRKSVAAGVVQVMAMLQ